MIRLETDVNLQTLNTMAIPSVASFFYPLSCPQALPELSTLAASKSLPVRTLGEGSNLVLPDKVEALVLHNKIPGIDVLDETNASIDVKVGAGENWHEFVCWVVEQGYSGLENLALIPGTVGAAPVQNIGAYGVEAGDFIVSVQAYDLTTNEFVVVPKRDCQFAYRSSLFKTRENELVITSVTFRLNKQFVPVLGYGTLQELASDKNLSPKKVLQHIVEVRQQKLPDPVEIPNAGSFFKNPVVTLDEFRRIAESFPDVVSYAADGGRKLAAGWLIDKAGLRGASGPGGVGSFKNQALVIVNPEKAGADSVLGWADQVCRKVFELFGVRLEIEPRRW
ncbi:UDP-N-acetylmuramate dehydrogenase [Reinekea marinisedimentorum]|uniref:UDP-N-acetylenolpyruvoylglucosamine reductase n=1 Tax=Reinekea marinisedimentorum TaxID=230495 RepID=A0A4R3IAL9_9GAMM|nr:UDP-N-acetylmuramate dehydrogenase [Reinekea marinisedimentorum]TCS42567.1 UDP-N-acetylmuramate dehydrogenase [Reinekea marinisedimentorum]